MEKFIITGGNPLRGTIKVSGAKNVALKVLVAACLTDEEVIIHNVPRISDVFVMIEIMKSLGAEVDFTDHTLRIQMEKFVAHEIPLEKAPKLRASFMFLAPLLARIGEAIIPNPGGDKIGARPIDRIIDGLRQMNADITYHPDGYFHAKTDGLHGARYEFLKNTHTGTETLLLAAVLAEGTTVLMNAAEEPEVDELIDLLQHMGANIQRSDTREITVHGVKKLHGATYTIGADINEAVTFAIAAILTKGDVVVEDVQENNFPEFLDKLTQAGGKYAIRENGIRFYFDGSLRVTDVTTAIYPGFKTDWQAPWAVLMTQADGDSVMHETIYEYRFGYVKALEKMGAQISFFNPPIKDPESFYNFNLKDANPHHSHAIKIHGPVTLHGAEVTMIDLRAGATLVLAALVADGTTIIDGVEHIERGYEQFDERLRSLGADIKRVA